MKSKLGKGDTPLAQEESSLILDGNSWKDKAGGGNASERLLQQNENLRAFRKKIQRIRIVKSSAGKDIKGD